ncbi:molybdopterin molybdenumtransferase MoeA [Streptomyces sp. SAT1]|uniref:molybdopterin molybdotransferase MoeA n=1 Tax=Streptomyces sp. SAT1 TaxID=1849967 RepID=UPI0007DD179B|nr:molybdopterin molybdotransferase MoeA [Streptomyces sp. SAT1]ANH92483.1 molybdopterin molybdenumtransferase MoeA [Streptomyces sp. SAT1]
MTARGAQTGEDAGKAAGARDTEDLDVEEALALANGGAGHLTGSGDLCGGGHLPGGSHLPGPGGGFGPGHRTGGGPASAADGAASPGHGTGSGPIPYGTPYLSQTDPSTTSWPAAREIAGRAARGTARRSPVSVALDAALGLVLAEPVAALTDLPSFDTSAMDGWAVAGPGPWDVREGGSLAGDAQPEPLTDGTATRIATGARIPQDTTAVLRTEHGRTDAKGRLHSVRELSHGQDIRPRGQECRSGEHLLPAGTLVTPAVLGLAAAAGYDTLTAVPRPRVDVFVLGDELLTEGLPREGRIRDALGPMLPSWLRALGAEVASVRRIGDDAKALQKALSRSAADLIVTTGGTAAGPVDHVRPTLRSLGADLLVDGVDVRPGHPMLLARTKEDQHLVGLPGNPLAAVSGLITLAEPLLRVLAARPAPEPYTLPLRDAVHGHPHDTRLVPSVLRGDHAVPLRYNGPAMLRGVAAADALAVVPAGGLRAGQEAELLDLPWAAAGIGVCFT